MPREPDRKHAGETWRHVAKQLGTRWPKLADLMDASEHDVLACMAFHCQHRNKLNSTNPIERLNKELKRRADVVGTSGHLDHASFFAQRAFSNAVNLKVAKWDKATRPMTGRNLPRVSMVNILLSKVGQHPGIAYPDLANCGEIRWCLLN